MDGPDTELIIASATQYLHDSAWPSLNISISPYRSVKSAEMSAVQHFAHELGKELAGDFSSTVWCSILPRVAQHEPAVWHGIVAVSTLDKDLRLDYGGRKHIPNNIAIRHYSKAMQELHLRLKNPEERLCKDVVLLCCVLFAVFECLQSHYQSVLRHISGGMQLLMERVGTEQFEDLVSMGSYLNRTTLQAIFLFLDSQAIQLGACEFRENFSGPALDDRLQITHFRTVEDAYLLLNQIFHHISHWQSWCEPVTAYGNKPCGEWMLQEKQRIQSQLDEWDAMCDKSLHLDKTRPAVLLLLVQKKVMQIFFSKCADGPSEMEWDKYLLPFEEAVTLAEAYMQSVARSPTGSAQSFTLPSSQSEGLRPVLTMAMDIILPLFLIGARCRDSRIRRRALRMLPTCGRREGVWDSWLCAEMVEKVIELEEGAASEDGKVPEHARMCMLDVRFREDRTAEVSLLVHDEKGLHSTDSFDGSVAW